jgi:hypothetical protein
MKYQHVVARQFGGPEVLRIVEYELPAPIGGRCWSRFWLPTFYAATASTSSCLAYRAEDFAERSRVPGTRHGTSPGEYAVK